MPVKRICLMLLFLPGLLLAQQLFAEPVDATSPVQQTAGQTDHAKASVYLMLTTLGGSPGGISIEFNGSYLGELHPGSGMIINLIPESRNYLLLRSRFSGINSIKLDTPAAEEKQYYRVYIDIFNPRVLRLERMGVRAGEQLATETTFIKPNDSP